MGPGVSAFERRFQYDRWPFRPLPQRAHSSGEHSLLPPGLAQRPAEGRNHRPADRGPGHRPLSYALCGADDPGSPLAGTELGPGTGSLRAKQTLFPKPKDGALSGRPGSAGGARAGLSLLLHPGGAPRRQRSPPGGRPDRLRRNLPEPDPRGTGGTGKAPLPCPAAASA